MEEYLSMPPELRSFARVSSGRRRRLAGTTILSVGMPVLALLAAAPASAEDECGTPAAGTVTCTAVGNPYANGVTYAPAAGDLTLDTTADAAISGAVTVDTTASGASGDVTFNHAGSVNTSVDGRGAVNLTGDNVAVNLTGTVTNAGANIEATTDENGNELTPFMPASGVNVVARGNVTIDGSGPVVTTGDNATGIVVRSSAGGVSGTIANVTTRGDVANIVAAGSIAIAVGNGISNGEDGAARAVSLTSNSDRVSVTAGGNVNASILATAATDAVITITTGSTVRADQGFPSGVVATGGTSASINLATGSTIIGQAQLTNNGGTAAIVIPNGAAVTGGVIVTGTTTASIVVEQGAYIGPVGDIDGGGGGFVECARWINVYQSE